MSEAEPAATSLQETDYRQLQFYARDLEQLYWSERQARSSLAEEKLVLEYRLHELKALHELFIKDLNEKQEAVETYKWLVERLKQIAVTTGEARLCELIREVEDRQPKPHNQPQST